MTQRIAVFIDYQNVYMGARGSFSHRDAPHWEGQVHPLRTAVRLKGGAADREVRHIRVYRGMPSSAHDQKGYTACQRQVAAWREKLSVHVTTRPLNYGGVVPREKGIDVQIAVDMVMMAMRNEYDVAILFSADTDLIPALSAVLSIKGPGSAEVAAWLPGDGRPANRLRLGDQVWCHLLSPDDYRRLHDPTDYTRPFPRRRSQPPT